jgi:hypothetical protein
MPKKCQDSDPPLGGDLYAGGTYSEGGTYMLVYTVFSGVARALTTTDHWQHEGQPRRTAAKDSREGQPRRTAAKDSREGQPRIRKHLYNPLRGIFIDLFIKHIPQICRNVRLRTCYPVLTYKHYYLSSSSRNHRLSLTV